MTSEYKLKLEEAEFLKELEEILGKAIPLTFKKIKWNTFRLKIEGKNVVELSLYNQGLKTLPNSIGFLFSLRKLYLHENHLTILPESIGNLSSLKKLYLHKNHLTTLPESIGNLKSLQELFIDDNQLKTLPESIGNLKSLSCLSLNNNFLTTLPESIGKLKSIQFLWVNDNQLSTLPFSIGNFLSLKELWLKRNKITTLPESIGNLKSLQILAIDNNILTTLPEPIGQLHLLQRLDIDNNKLMTLPVSIGNLSSLKELSLWNNQLSILPESMRNLKSLKSLWIYNNQLSTIPVSIWPLINLKTLQMDNNPLDDESKEILKRDIPTILEFCRKRALINIFITHAWNDQETYRIDDLKHNLENRKEIYEVFICEETTGNIQEFMRNKIPESQILIFIGTKNSFDSQDCRHELEMAIEHRIEIIPIKGHDIKEWEDFDKIPLKLKESSNLSLSQQKGFQINLDDFNRFCNELYDYIKQYKRDINLFDSKETRIDKIALNIKNSINNFLNSNEFKKNIKEKEEMLEILFQELSEKHISLAEYFARCGQILLEK